MLYLISVSNKTQTLGRIQFLVFLLNSISPEPYFNSFYLFRYYTSKRRQRISVVNVSSDRAIGLYRDVWIAAIASSRKSLATQTAAICVRFQGRRVRHEYVTMHITFLTRKSALIYRWGLRQRVASLTLDCNGVFAIRAYRNTGEPDIRLNVSPVYTEHVIVSGDETVVSNSKRHDAEYIIRNYTV